MVGKAAWMRGECGVGSEWRPNDREGIWTCCISDVRPVHVGGGERQARGLNAQGRHSTRGWMRAGTRAGGRRLPEVLGVAQMCVDVSSGTSHDSCEHALNHEPHSRVQGKTANSEQSATNTSWE